MCLFRTAPFWLPMEKALYWPCAAATACQHGFYAVVERLEPDGNQQIPVNTLLALQRYHVGAGRAFSSDLTNDNLAMLAGGNATVNPTNGTNDGPTLQVPAMVPTVPTSPWPTLLPKRCCTPDRQGVASTIKLQRNIRKAGPCRNRLFAFWMQGSTLFDSDRGVNANGILLKIKAHSRKEVGVQGSFPEEKHAFLALPLL